MPDIVRRSPFFSFQFVLVCKARIVYGNNACTTFLFYKGSIEGENQISIVTNARGVIAITVSKESLASQVGLRFIRESKDVIHSVDLTLRILQTALFIIQSFLLIL